MGLIARLRARLQPWGDRPPAGRAPRVLTEAPIRVIGGRGDDAIAPNEIAAVLAQWGRSRWQIRQTLIDRGADDREAAELARRWVPASAPPPSHSEKDGWWRGLVRRLTRRV